MSVFTTLRHALRVGSRIRTLGRVKPWSWNGASFSGGFSAEASLTLLLTMVSRALLISTFTCNQCTCIFGLRHEEDKFLALVRHFGLLTWETEDLSPRKR